MEDKGSLPTGREGLSLDGGGAGFFAPVDGLGDPEPPSNGELGDATGDVLRSSSASDIGERIIDNGDGVAACHATVAKPDLRDWVCPCNVV